jgi:membrane fusion protein (multidrug efflux system)
MGKASHVPLNIQRLVCAIAACAVAPLVFVSCSKADAQRAKVRGDGASPVAVAAVELVPLDRTLPVIGTLFAKDEATVAAQVEGQVEKTLVDFGDRVTEGQELARIDTTAYEAQARQSAANLAKAQAGAANAEQTLKRTQDLQKQQISSQSDLDKAVADAEQARADVKAAEAANAIAQLNLERSHVRAPFNGAVAERIASAGDYMKIGSPLFRLVNDSVLKFIFQVPERNASFVTKGLRVQFNVDNYPNETFTGSVYLISPAVSTASRAFNVGALVTNTDFKLKASTFARGTLTLERAVPTPMIPLEAVVSFAGVTKVFVVENNIARARTVAVGRIRDGKQEITQGLKEGERVVVSGQSRLSDGTAVAIQSAEPTVVAPALAKTNSTNSNETAR